jgi:16S rRNA (cytosine1402-N4)-methyltransferase
MLSEALEALKIKPGGFYIDATFGGGGHTEGILQKRGRVLAIDLDSDAIEHGVEKFNLDKKGDVARGEGLTLVRGNFANVGAIAREFGVNEADGILFDLGVSSFQLERPEKGFSFLREGPLDMRMDPDLSVTAADLVNGLREEELYELFSRYGEERFSRSIARAIVRSRLKTKIETTEQLAKLVESVVRKKGKLHPATRVFQALRIAVNDEINSLRKALPEAGNLLRKDGRLVVISFHSLEDREVKNFMAGNPNMEVVTKKPLVPSEEELQSNNRARSAKMRVASRL